MENNNWKWYEDNSANNGQNQGYSPNGGQQYNASDNPYSPNGNGRGGNSGSGGKKHEKRFSVGQLIACMLVMALLAGGIGAGVSLLVTGANNSSSAGQSAMGGENSGGIITDESKLPTSGTNDDATAPSESNSGSDSSDVVIDSHASEGLVISNDNTDSESDRTAIIQSCMSSVVGIDISEEVTTNSYGWYGGSSSDSTTSETVGSGSGVIITSDGYIATNNHVVEGADGITVYLQDGTEYEATLIGTDSITDLAIIKIDAENLSAATIGTSGNVTVGDTVYAIGNPLGVLAASVSQGIISGLDRLVTVEDQEMTLMQTDASVNPGNSGGGLFNADGELIGIVNSKASGDNVEGIGFAIPIDSAKSVLIDLMDLGYVSGRPYLGITMQDVYLTTGTSSGPSMFGSYSNYETRVQVYSVEEGSAAYNAGMKEGDVILTFDGVDITGASALSATMYEYSIGDTVIITVLRDQQQIELTVTLGERTK